MMAIVLCTALATSVVAQFTSDDYATQPQPFTLVNDGSANFNPVIGDNGINPMVYANGASEQHGWRERPRHLVHAIRWRKVVASLPMISTGLNTKKNDLVVGQSENTLVYILRYNQNSNKELTSINAFKRIDGVYEHDHVIELP